MDFNKDDRDLMWKYDRAVIIGENKIHGPSIETPYGIAHIGYLSTGLKTLLNLRHIKSMPQYVAIDITEAGENIILNIFKEAIALDVPIILGHTDIPDFSPISILVDDNKIVNRVSQLEKTIWSKA